jgi:hypothetical protein
LYSDMQGEDRSSRKTSREWADPEQYDRYPDPFIL